MKTVKLIESQLTWQGECVDTGKYMLLLRFKECDRVEHKKPCVWCDTLVPMRVKNEADHNIDSIQNIINDAKVGVILSGGEPTWDANYESCKYLLNNLKYSVANVETNGFRLVELLKEIDLNKNIKFIYSPKIFNQNDLDETYKNINLIRDNKRVYLKIVCDNTDLIENKFLEYLHECKFDNSRVFLMPEGKTKEEIIKNASHTFDLCEKYKFNFSSREHIIYDFV